MEDKKIGEGRKEEFGSVGFIATGILFNVFRKIKKN